MPDEAKVREIVYQIIAETFDCTLDSITDATQSIDVDGWDSLAHSILMVRLQRALNVTIPETLASQATDVGDLVRRLTALKHQTSGGTGSRGKGTPTV
jgi:acyl carrier protein